MSTDSIRPSIPDEAERAARRATGKTRASFFVTPGFDDLITSLDTLIGALQPTVRDVGAAFRHNLQSVVATVGFPLTLASNATHDRRFQLFHLAEKIRSLKIQDSPEGDVAAAADDSSQNEAAVHTARRKFMSFVGSTEGQTALAQEACFFLSTALDAQDVQVAAAELLRQGTVLVWGTFEVLARDLFVSYLNAVPSAAATLTENPVTKRKFEIKSIAFERLARHDFDISRKMGSLLIELNDLGDLGTIKDTYLCLFSQAQALRTALESRELWILNQRRHLIVHRRSTVDSAYLANTGESFAIGSTLAVTPDQLEEYIRIVGTAGIAMLTSVKSGVL